MNWKTLGKAALVACGLFGILALTFFLGYFFPWICVVLAFVSVLAIVYSAMDKEEDCDSDNDRMQWFSCRNDEDEEED